MEDKVSKEQFLKLVEELLQGGPKVKYQNPDGWINYRLKQTVEEEMKKNQREHEEEEQHK